MKLCSQNQMPTHWRQKSFWFFLCGQVESVVMSCMKEMLFAYKGDITFPCVTYHNAIALPYWTSLGVKSYLFSL